MAAVDEDTLYQLKTQSYISTDVRSASSAACMYVLMLQSRSVVRAGMSCTLHMVHTQLSICHYYH
jgi:hypothetical protein